MFEYMSLTAIVSELLVFVGLGLIVLAGIHAGIRVHKTKISPIKAGRLKISLVDNILVIAGALLWVTSQVIFWRF